MVLKACQEKDASQTNGSAPDNQQSNGAGSSDSSMKPPEEKRVSQRLNVAGIQVIFSFFQTYVNFLPFLLLLLLLLVDAASRENYL